MRKDSKATGQVLWTVSLILFMYMLMKQEVHGQWFEHRLQVAGTHGLLDLSDDLPEKKTVQRFIWKSMNGTANLNFLLRIPNIFSAAVAFGCYAKLTIVLRRPIMRRGQIYGGYAQFVSLLCTCNFLLLAEN